MMFDTELLLDVDSYFGGELFRATKLSYRI
jgi:hypothetical protein